MKSQAVLLEEDRARDGDLAPGLPRALRVLLEAPPAGPTTEPEPDTAGVWTAHAPVTREFLARLRRVAEQDAPVYLFGEPGSGLHCAARTMCRWRGEWDERGRPGATGQPLPVRILRVPSLRERPQDLPEIAARHLEARARDAGLAPPRLTPRGLAALLARRWRGNIVELHAVLDHAAQRAGERLLIDVEDLPQGAEPMPSPSQQAKDTAQRACLLRQLRLARTVRAAAELEGCSRANYIRLMRRLGILRADCVGVDLGVQADAAPALAGLG